MKPGDRIERIGGNYQEVRHGGIYTLKTLIGIGATLEECEGEYDIFLFRPHYGESAYPIF